MSFRRNRPLINERVKRMLQMVEDTVITSADQEAECPEITPKASTSAMSDGQTLSKDTDCDIIAVDPESSVKETFSNQVLSKYELRDKTNKKYFDTDQESDEDFSPDVSKYAPSPSSNIFKSPLSSVLSLSEDSACINKIIAFPEIISTPSTISNLSLYLTNADFVASSSEIYNNKATLDLSHPIIEKENQSRPNIRRTISSQEYIDDTFKPDETLEINHNETLTGRTSNDCSHAREVVTDNEDSPSLIRKICSEEENNETLRPEEQSESNNDTTLTGRTSSDCEHMEAVENEKKLTRKRKQNRSEWRSKKIKSSKIPGKPTKGAMLKKNILKKL